MIQSFRRLLPAIGIASLLSCAIPPHTVKPRIASESYLIPSSDAGIQLYIRNKHAEGMSRYSAERTVIYVNGATQAGEATFDLQLDGFSWMDYLAARGYDVYLVDLRGYGGSSRPPEMNQPAANNSPIVRTDTAVKDLGSAIDHVLAHCKLQTLDVIGWSWGATIAGAYTAQHNEKVNRLVLYAPQWLREAAAVGRPSALGAYQAWSVQQGRDRLQAGTPEAAKNAVFPPRYFKQWAAAALATDRAGAVLHPPVIRTPNGIFQDNQDYWFAGRAVWDPSQLTVPTLVARGEWDEVTTLADTLGVFHALMNAPSKRMIIVGSGSHMVFIEKNREQLFREVQLFLDESAPRN